MSDKDNESHVLENYYFSLFDELSDANPERDNIFSVGFQKLDDYINKNNGYVGNITIDRHIRLTSFLNDLGITKIKNIPVISLTNKELERIYNLIITPIKSNTLIIDGIKNINLNNLNDKEE